MKNRDWSLVPLVATIGVVLMVSVAISHYGDGVDHQGYPSVQAAPVRYEVDVNVTWPPPPPTTTPTPDAKLTPSPTATGDCATSTPNNTVCTKLIIPATEEPPLDCNDPESDQGDSCLWVWTATPTPTYPPRLFP